MALRNISNLLRRQSLQQQQQQPEPLNCQMYPPIYESHYEMVKHEHLRASMRSKSASCALPLSSIPPQQQQQQQNSSGASSVQIRTSSPISTSSSCSSGPANSIISPSKFMRAAQQKYHQSRSSCRRIDNYYEPHLQQQQQQQMYNAKLPHYFSMKEIAYQNLRRQQSTAKVQKLIASSSNRPEPLRSCGKLRVAAYKNSGLLTVHIIQGRHYRKLMQQIDPTDTNKLFCERIGTSDTYTTVAMLPDPELRLKCKTAVIKDSRAPIYDDKFSFELDPLNDFNNRIVISVWRASPTHAKPTIDNLTAELLGASTVYDELVGCFSFKIKHLVEKGGFQPDWYHLLPFNYGIKKHLKCKSGGGDHEQNTSDPEKHVANVNKDLVGLKKLRFGVERASEGFGFTLTGSCPCHVSKVEPDRPAARSGLKPGDFIATINNVNVSRASRETVVKLIKNTKHQLSIEVYRANDEPRKQSQQQQQHHAPNPYVMPLQTNYHILMNPNMTSSSASSSLNDYQPPNVENYYMIHPSCTSNNKYQPKSTSHHHQENPYYEQTQNYRVKSKNSSSQSSSGVSSAYENIEQDFSDQHCFDYSTAEAVRCTQHSSSIVVAKSDRDFNLPQIHLTNYQSQPQLLYGLEAVPEEDENMSEHVVSHRKEELVLLNENEFDHDDDDDDDELPSPTPPLATSHDLVSPSHLTAFGLVQSTIRYVDATTDEDEEPYALTTSQMAAYKHCQTEDEYNQENIDELRRVAAQYYSTTSLGSRVATKISLRNQK